MVILTKKKLRIRNIEETRRLYEGNPKDRTPKKKIMELKTIYKMELMILVFAFQRVNLLALWELLGLERLLY